MSLTELKQHVYAYYVAYDAYSSKQNEFGGLMHQLQEPAYKAFPKDEQAANPILVQAKNAGPEFWDQAFARLTAQ